MIEARNLKGFRDQLPREALARDQVVQKLKSVFLSFGFAPIETPHLEYSEVLLPNEGDEVAKQLFRFRDQGDRDVMLRYDLTVPFARFAVQHRNDLGMPFKRFAVGSVFRGEAPQFGRYREFTQCDFDIVGSHSVVADAEIALVLARCYSAIGLSGVEIRINNRRLVNGIFEAFGIRQKFPEILRVIDKLDKIGEKAVVAELIRVADIKAPAAQAVLDFLGESRRLSNQELLAKLKLQPSNDNLSQGIAEIEGVLKALGEVDLAPAELRIDLSLARGLAYYTGVVFEVVHPKVPEVGSIGGGGRYDNLTKSFGKDELPGVGASVGLDRVIDTLEKLGLLGTTSTPARVLCAQVETTFTSKIIQMAEFLRAQGIRSEVYPEVAKLKKQLQYGDRKGHEYLIIVGSDEATKGVWAVKNLRDRTQTEAKSLEEIVALVKQSSPDILN